MRTRPHAFSGRHDKMIEAVLTAHKDAQKEVKRSFRIGSVYTREGHPARFVFFVAVFFLCHTAFALIHEKSRL